MTRNHHKNRPAPSRAPTTLLALLCGLAALSGCGLFKPASPEIPTSTGVRARYVQPDSTLATMALAIQDKAASNGQTAYIGAYGDGFKVVFDPATLARYSSSGRTPETNWTNDMEVAFYAKFSQIQPTAIYTMIWGEDPSAVDDERTATTATLHRSYRVYAQLEGAENQQIIARGFADLEFTLVGGDWKIVKWTDREDPQADLDNGELCFGQRRQESRSS